MKKLVCRSLLSASIFALATAPASRADQPVMHQARALANQAADLLKNVADADKGGHRVAAFKLLKQAVEEMNAGIEFDRTHAGPNETKRLR